MMTMAPAFAATNNLNTTATTAGYSSSSSNLD